MVKSNRIDRYRIVPSQNPINSDKMDELTKSYQVMQLTFEKIEQERQQLAKENEKLKRQLESLKNCTSDYILCMLCENYEWVNKAILCENCEHHCICESCEEKNNLKLINATMNGAEIPPHITSFLENLNLRVTGNFFGRVYLTCKE